MEQEKYYEWKNLKRIYDEKNRFCALFEYEDGSRFYIEPLFYKGLFFYRDFSPHRYEDILKEMERQVRKNKLVVFTADDNDPVTKIDENVRAIYLNIYDITERIHLINEPKLYKTDYGD